MTEINNIPKHWQVKKLGEVCTNLVLGVQFGEQTQEIINELNEVLVA